MKVSEQLNQRAQDQQSVLKTKSARRIAAVEHLRKAQSMNQKQVYPDADKERLEALYEGLPTDERKWIDEEAARMVRADHCGLSAWDPMTAGLFTTVLVNSARRQVMAMYEKVLATNVPGPDEFVALERRAAAVRRSMAFDLEAGRVDQKCNEPR